jgi:methionyl aminopeptidase
MIYIKSKEEIAKIRASNQIVAQSLAHIRKFVKPGVTTGELNREIEEFIVKQNARPAFKGLYGFPASACISIQDEVVHGIPSVRRKLAEGEIVGIDVGVELDGYFGDAAYTFIVGDTTEAIKKLLKVTEESLYLGINACVEGNRVGDIGHAIQHHVEQHGYGIVRELVGHGVGIKPHEEPQVPNYGMPGKGTRLKSGMVLAIEPMVNMGGADVFFADDEWTVKTTDGLPSAHFEHSVALTDNGPEILSKLDGE